MSVVASAPQSTVRSMTGFATAEGRVNGQRFRAEIKCLNHRFLDVKVRLPKPLNALEPKIRAIVESELDRGSVDLKLESLPEASELSTEYRVNRAVIAYYHSEAEALQKQLGLKHEIRIEQLLSLPDSVTRGSTVLAESQDPEACWLEAAALVRECLRHALEMREREGRNLKQVLESGVATISRDIDRLRKRRSECQEQYRQTIMERITTVFDAYPITDKGVKSVLESRLAQELALILDRTDIAEELDRLDGHMDHFRKVLEEGSPAGRKLEFLLQEINREVNTLGNKAQDLSISEDVVRLKVLVEQLREQSLNVE